MLLALLSPSKTLNFEDDLSVSNHSSPELLTESKQLATKLKNLSTADIKKLMGISDKLATLNHDRFQDFKSKPTPKNARQALLAFRGDVYQGFRLSEYSAADFNRAQKTIRILSGLYGVLRPLDLIQPYRLEMSTALKTDKSKDLYGFWGTKITRILNKHLKEYKSKYVIDLASQEYSKAIQFEDLEVPTVRVDFKEKKDGKLRTVALFAKQARGQMANFIVQKKIKTLQDLTAFKENGYRFAKKESSDSTYLFVR